MSEAPSNSPLSPPRYVSLNPLYCVSMSCIPLSRYVSVSSSSLYLSHPEFTCPTNVSGPPAPTAPCTTTQALPANHHALHWPIGFPTSPCLFHFHALAWDPTQAYASCIDIKHTYRHCFSASVPSQTQHTPDSHHSAFSFTRRLREPSRRAARSIWHPPWPPDQRSLFGISRRFALSQSIL